MGDTIFGEENRIGLISVINNMKGRSDSEFFATCHEYLLVYAKQKDEFKISGFEISEEEIDDDYSWSDEIGCYKPIALRKTGNGWHREDRPYMFYPVLERGGVFSVPPKEELDNLYDSETLSFDDEYLSQLILKYENDGYRVFVPKDEQGNFGRWRWGIDKFKIEKEYNVVINNAGTLCSKMRANIEDGSIRMKLAKTVFYKPEYDTGSGAKALKTLFGGGDYFDNPKSLVYLSDLVRLVGDKECLVLDFFSGSATTAHAVMQLNAEDGGNRKFIMVQLPELTYEIKNGQKVPLKQSKAAFEAGFENVCEIGKERIRRAGKKIKEENATNAPNLDIGFRVLKVVDSPMVDASKPAGETTQAELSFSSVKTGVKNDALLFHTMLRLGIAPTDTIEYKTIEGNKVACVGGTQLVAALDAQTQMTNTFIEAIMKMNPGVAVFRDDTFRNNNALRISLEQTFKQLSKETKIEVI